MPERARENELFRACLRLACFSMWTVLSVFGVTSFFVCLVTSSPPPQPLVAPLFRLNTAMEMTQFVRLFKTNECLGEGVRCVRYVRRRERMRSFANAIRIAFSEIFMSFFPRQVNLVYITVCTSHTFASLLATICVLFAHSLCRHTQIISYVVYLCRVMWTAVVHNFDLKWKYRCNQLHQQQRQ